MLFDRPIFIALESMTHKIQRFCGLDNFHLAQITSVFFALAGFDTFMNIAPFPNRPSQFSLEEQKLFILVWKIIYIPISLILGAGSAVTVTYISKKVYSNQIKGLSNHLKIDPEIIWLRFLLWFSMGYFIFSMSGDIFIHPQWIIEDINQTPLALYSIVAVFLWVYLICCDPLPKAPSWLREKLNSFIYRKQSGLVESN